MTENLEKEAVICGAPIKALIIGTPDKVADEFGNLPEGHNEKGEEKCKKNKKQNKNLIDILSSFWSDDKKGEARASPFLFIGQIIHQ